jgi:ADP-ribose pyrophosphatase YjhB (NUDIX family)
VILVRYRPGHQATYAVAVECEHILVADVTILVGDRTLLVRYKDTTAYDGQAGWFVPDDELRRREHPRRAAARIVREQLGITPRRLVVASIESFGGRGWHLIFHYATRLRTVPELRLGANVLEAAWFATEGLPPAAETAHEGWAHGIVAAAVRSLPA